MSDSSELSLVYNKTIVINLIERTKPCTLIWSKIDPTTYKTNTIEGLHVWDFYLKRINNNLSYYYKLDIYLDTQDYLSLNSLANTEVTSELTELFERVEFVVNDELAPYIEVSEFVKSIANSGHIWDYVGLGGVVISGHVAQPYSYTGSGGVIVGGSAEETHKIEIGGVIVGGSAAITYPQGPGIYMGGNFGQLRKYNKNLFDNIAADPNGASTNLLWQTSVPVNLPPNYSGLSINDIVVGQNGYIYVTGTAGSYNGVDTAIYDSNANQITEIIHPIDLTPGSVNTNGQSFTGIDVDTQGNFVVVGQPLGNLFTDPSGVKSIWKHDIDGNILFSANWGYDYNFLSSVTYATDVCVDSQGNFYVVGDWIQDPSDPTHTKKFNFRKYDSNGTIVWSKETPGYPGEVFAITTDDTYLYLCGDTGLGLMKYDLNGNLIWQVTTEVSETSGTRNIPTLYDIALGKNGQIIVGGKSSGNTTTVSGTSYYYQNYLRSFDQNGNRIWMSSGLSDKAIQINSISCDGTNIYAGADSNFAIGIFSASTGSESFLMTLPFNIYTGPSFETIFALKLDPQTSAVSGGVKVGGSAVTNSVSNNNILSTGGVVVGGAAQTSDKLAVGFRSPLAADNPTTADHRWAQIGVNGNMGNIDFFIDDTPSVYNVCRDKSGNVYTVGNAYIQSLHVKKYDPNKIIVWQTRISPSDSTTAFCITVDDDYSGVDGQNVFVGCRFNRSITGSHLFYKYEAFNGLRHLYNDGFSPTVYECWYIDYSTTPGSSPGAGFIFAGYGNGNVDTMDGLFNLQWGINSFPCMGITSWQGTLYQLAGANNIDSRGELYLDTPIYLPARTDNYDSTTRLITDNDGYVWLSWNKGIYKFKRTGELLAYSQVTIADPNLTTTHAGIAADIDNNLYVNLIGTDSQGTKYAYIAKIFADTPYLANPTVINDLSVSFDVPPIKLAYIKQLDINPLYPTSISATKWIS